MHVWKALREHIDELRLSALQREVARGLIEGRRSREIAEALGIEETQVHLCAAYIWYVVHRRPPGAAAGAMAFPRRPIKPLDAAAALKLPE